MATVEDCRQALESLTGQLAQLDPADRAAHLVDRDVSCHISDLGVTFHTTLGMDGAGPITLENGSGPASQVRLTASSDDLVGLAADPGSFIRAWLTGKIKIQASISDLLRLRKLL